MRHLEEKARVRFCAMPTYSDYYPEMRGAKSGYRTCDSMPFDASQLGEEFARMRPPTPGTLIGGRVQMTAGEAHTLLTKERGWVLLFIRKLARYWLDLPWRFRTRRDRRLTLGNALVGSLRRSMMDRNIPLWLETPLESLVYDGRRIAGVTAIRDGKIIRIGANRGVILAAGGFEHNQDDARSIPAPADQGGVDRHAPRQHRRRDPRRAEGRGEARSDGPGVVGADRDRRRPREAARTVRRARVARMRDGQQARPALRRRGRALSGYRDCDVRG